MSGIEIEWQTDLSPFVFFLRSPVEKVAMKYSQFTMALSCLIADFTETWEEISSPWVISNQYNGVGPIFWRGDIRRTSRGP
jgi:hypothetical protein